MIYIIENDYTKFNIITIIKYIKCLVFNVIKIIETSNKNYFHSGLKREIKFGSSLQTCDREPTHKSDVSIWRVLHAKGNQHVDPGAGEGNQAAESY